MFKTTIAHKVSPQTRLDQIFKDGLPPNSFVDKGRCAIGATYQEIMNKLRCSILAVPNISILLCKQASHPEIDIVYGDISYADVKVMLQNPKPGHKIMTTPEGMWKIMKAAEETGRLEEVYNDWFLLLDEAHTFISEHYREDILKPFEYFWKFTNKTIISATPYVFTDERFHALIYHKIEFTAPLGTIRLVNAVSPDAVLNHILKHIDLFPGNVHIFYNSVRAIRDAILRSELPISWINIYCADDTDGKNLNNLGALKECFVPQPTTGEYKKVNFYTSRYFEGWDLYDENATIILVTDVHKEHTKVGIGTKGKQAIGRLRNIPNELIHITNHNYTKEMKPLEYFRKKYLMQANLHIKANNQLVKELKENALEITEDERLIKFCDVDKKTKIATLNQMKLDQQINEATNDEIYNDIDYIQRNWENGYYEVEQEDSDIRLDSTTVLKRKSAAKQLEEDYQALVRIGNDQQLSGLFDINKTLQNEIKKRNPLAFEAWKLVDERRIIELKYNVKKVRAAIIVKENTLSEVKLLKLLNQTFSIGRFYSNEDIKNKLQTLYKQLNIRDEAGNIKVATAKQIANNGWFEVKGTKKANSKGVQENGQVLLRPQFSIRMVA